MPISSRRVARVCVLLSWGVFVGAASPAPQRAGASSLRTLADVIACAIVAATGDDGFNATLALDARTCVPVALTYTHPPNMGDILRLRGTGAAPPASITAGIELSDYRATNGLSFPRRIRWLRDGEPTGEWRVIDLQVNPALPADVFSVH